MQVFLRRLAHVRGGDRRDPRGEGLQLFVRQVIDCQRRHLRRHLVGGGKARGEGAHNFVLGFFQFLLPNLVAAQGYNFLQDLGH